MFKQVNLPRNEEQDEIDRLSCSRDDGCAGWKFTEFFMKVVWGADKGYLRVLFDSEFFGEGSF